MTRSCVLTLLAVLSSATAAAQGIEVSPFYGYRFGGDLFEIAPGRPVDLDGAPALGVTVDVPLWNGLHVEGMFTHQRGEVLVPTTAFGPLNRWRVDVDHWVAGALQEVGDARVRPFASALLGLTRYAVEGDSEMRFTVSFGGGVKIFPASHFGLRLDGRVLTTLIDADGHAAVCGGGACFVSLHLNVAWQAEFTSAVIVRFP
jgi:hypothetical protein